MKYVAGCGVHDSGLCSKLQTITNGCLWGHFAVQTFDDCNRFITIFPVNYPDGSGTCKS